MPRLHEPVLLLLLAGVCGVLGCQIEVLVKSETNKPTFAQFTSPDGQKSPLWLFKIKDQNRRFNINMDNCLNAPMVVETFKVDGSGEKGSRIAITKAFVNGNGFVDYTINADRLPRMQSRIGVFCSFGDCGARGKRSVRADRYRA